MKIFLKKTDSGFIPAGQSDLDYHKKIKLGSIIECDVKQPRNLRHHRKLMALLRFAVHNWPEGIYNSIDELLISLKFKVGFVKDARMIGGKIIAIPKSISFKNTDQIEFAEVYDKFLDTICNELSIAHSDVMKELEGFM